MPKIGVVIGRFQYKLPSSAHIDLIKKAASENEGRVLILIGCTRAQPNAHDPLSYRARRHAIIDAMKAFPRICYDIAPIVDCDNNETWSSNVDIIIDQLSEGGKATIYAGEGSSVHNYYTGKHEFSFVDIDTTMTSATTLRTQLLAGMDEELKNMSTRAGIILAHMSRFPVSFQTVDIIIVDPVAKLVALGRKPGQIGWRLPGGFVDVTDQSLEKAAKREAHEETDLEVSVKYLGSRRVNDSRYADSTDKICTAVFVGHVVGSAMLTAKDDLAEVKWFGYETIWKMLENPTKDLQIASTHRPLFQAFFKSAIGEN